MTNAGCCGGAIESGQSGPEQVKASTIVSESSDLYPDRVILTTYPGQTGIEPIGLTWGARDAQTRGPVVVARTPSTMKVRNAIGASAGSYCIYHALAVAMGALPVTHRPDYTNTEPPVQIGPHDSWYAPKEANSKPGAYKIVSLDPWGAMAPQIFKSFLDKGIDVRPSAAITKAHIMVPEVTALIQADKLAIDKSIVLNKQGELLVTKVAMEPVWWLPGVADRFSVPETLLRRALFEDTGGMYPELVTRPDLKTYLPPIGGLTAYIFGPVEYLSDPSKRLTVRIHDECNGSDVFGSDICTCRPYLIYGIEACVREAQNGGCGLIVYFRKEGRALGEVTKYLVYNARKRQEGGDSAATYFQRTESIAGVKDMRFQALMPDVLHWLGIQKIDRFISMSNMKYDAVVGSGIPILERVPIPDELVPPDSKVEIDAKIAAGYFTHGKVPTEKDLEATKGRTWDDIHH